MPWFFAECCIKSDNVSTLWPKDATFKWIGWDFLKSNDIKHLKELTMSIFYKTSLNYDISETEANNIINGDPPAK